MHSILEIDSVIKSFGLKKILSNVYLKCQTGEIIGILGRNGCGKSTLLKIVFGTMPADNKTIKIDNNVYFHPYRSRNLIAYLPQHSFLPEHINLKQIINAFIKGIENRKVIINDDRIKKHLNKKTKELSGGELRYFEILLLVNLNAKFVLLDEPFSGIEPIYKEKIKELIKKYIADKGFIITDHDYKNVIDVSDQIILIKDGTLKNIENLEQLEEYNYLPTGTLIRNLEGHLDEESTFAEFEVDKQTLQDLDLFKNLKGGLIHSIFNKAKTTGGSIQLNKILKTPVSSIKILENRRDAIKFFYTENIKLKIKKGDIDLIEYYLSSNISFSKKNIVDSIYQHIRYQFKADQQHFTKITGIQKTVSLLEYLTGFIKEHQHKNAPPYLSSIFFNIQEILLDYDFRDLFSLSNNKYLQFIKINKYDYLFRQKGMKKLKRILEMLYELDVFESVANTAKNYKLSFPEYSNSAAPDIQLEGLYHPLLKNPVANDFHIGKSGNLCFLTGANMSGKSTFLKSFGLAVYLAHVGFPVSAKRMKTSIFNGLITTINLADNITQGYSHFYSEVKRVKEAAAIIKEKKQVVVIFDELFRGTNVKDASDASLMITSALSKIQKSIFLISTHIVEIAEDLKNNPTIFFNCFKSKIEAETPIYSYKLGEGITKERFGMQIVKNEKIIELLEDAQKEQPVNIRENE